MREHDLRGITRRRRRSLTRLDKKAVFSPDLVERGFTAVEPGTKLVSDITYLPTLAGWWYLATVIDLATREVIGYAMADHHRAELVIDALKMAAGRGMLKEGCIAHYSSPVLQRPVESAQFRSQQFVAALVLTAWPARWAGSGRRVTTPRWRASSRCCRRTSSTAEPGPPARSCASRS